MFPVSGRELAPGGLDMIPIRLPWRHRARPSATLHEILSAPEGQTCRHDRTTADQVRQDQDNDE